MNENALNHVSWTIIEQYFKENEQCLVSHHINSYNYFISNGIPRIFKENNPCRFLENVESNQNECLIYLGGKNGNAIYFGKPVIYDETTNYKHYMYPNDARLRNMTYGITIHYDVDIEFIYYNENGERVVETNQIEKVFLGKFPIMVQSKLCILNGLSTNVRFNLGECRNDFGGYFIIDGKEKVIISQEKFADNMLYIKENPEGHEYTHSAEIRSVSEDTSKPIRVNSVAIVATTPNYSNKHIVVNIPNVRKPVPLFVLMRALGIESDKQIIEYCLLDLEKNKKYIDLFIPSVHHASVVFNQQSALEFIGLLTKHQSVYSAHDVLMNYFLAHIGTDNYIDKAYFVGYMVRKLLRVYLKDEHPTDRDNFKCKRIELSGSLMYDLFREYYLKQKQKIKIEVERLHYNNTQYSGSSIVNSYSNIVDIFKKHGLMVEDGVRKGFKGKWGSMQYTQRVGLVQDLSRLSWNSCISHLRKINLDMDPTAKVVKPHLLNNSQFGYIDPVDTPDGGNVGLHKHLAISTIITTEYSGNEFINWLFERFSEQIVKLHLCLPNYANVNTKLFVNGRWIGLITEDPLKMAYILKLYKRNGVIPFHTCIFFNYKDNELCIYTDGGRMTRPLYYVDSNSKHDRSYVRAIPERVSSRKHKPSDLQELSSELSWTKIVSGFAKKTEPNFNPFHNTLYTNDLIQLKHDDPTLIKDLSESSSVIEYMDGLEEESALIAFKMTDIGKFHTHLEIDPSLMLGVLGNSIIYPEHNPLPRNAFSCGQSKQAVSMYHTNYQMRLDKMSVILQYGQIPLIKSRYLDLINKEENPYGVNAIVAIMSYTGYNVEDAILINQGAVDRGIFRTTYHTLYETSEDMETSSEETTKTTFFNFRTGAVKTSPGYDYSFLDENGVVIENTPINDKIVMIGAIKTTTSDAEEISNASVFTKKGQLGYVDKTFITENEKGLRLAKIRVREERMPAIGDKMACALPTQQVLTNEGWIEIQNIDITKHKVATLDVNGNMCYEFPTNKFIYDHNGKMYSVSNKQVEVVCTLNHKLYVKKREHNGNKKEYELIEAQHVIGKMVRFQKSIKNVYPDVECIELGEKKYKMDDWLQLLGMFISDGSVNNRAVVLSAHKERKVNFNTDILTKLDIDFYHDNYHGYFAINLGKNKEIYHELKQYSIGALNKYLPEYVWNLSKRQCIILLEALMEGDGHTYSDGFSRYGTISPRLANDICRLAVHCGWSGITKIAAEPGDYPHTITGTKGYNAGKSHTVESKHTYYKISIIRKQNQPYINKKVNDSNEEKLIDYKGKVYCIEMPSSHLYYMRENILAPSMLIGNSRAGQKGTIGLVIPEKDMPFTEDGIKPDLIINPHAIPSRMTIGQLVECVFGKACLANGAFGNCTAFETNGPNHELYGKLLNDAGFHSSGTQILYNGMTGEQIESNIYIGPTYYMRLKHMVKDKINYRSNDGPNTMLTRQPVQGRANDGGLRIGEMERDAIMSHGMTSFLSDSFLKRADEYYMAVCNKTGMIAVYNPEEDIFFSPSADGPGQFGEIEGKPIKQISRFGRSFSMVRVPYSFKQLIQELQVLNVQMRLITDDNVDNLLNMTESNNINKLLKIKTDSTDLSYLLKAHLENQTKRVNGEIEMKPMVTQIEELKKVAPIVQVREPPKINAPVDQNQVVEIDWNDMPENNKQTTWNVPSQWNPASQWNAPSQWNAQPQPQPIVIEKEKEKEKEEDIKEVDFSIPQIVPILPKKQEEEILPEGWTKQISKKHNKPYYYNETTKKSVWKFEDIPVPKQTILTTIEEGEEETKVEEKNETRTIQASKI